MTHTISAIDRLLTYAEPALTRSAPHLPSSLWQRSFALLAELITLLNERNGFFAFEKALHIFPATASTGTQPGYDLIEWNSERLWKKEFPEEVQRLLCFAEDAFGCQWALREDHICKFDPETGEATRFADNFEDWARQIVENARIETGWPLSQQWRRTHGELPAKSRMNPKRLFILGGSFALENLFAIDAAEGMRFRGEIARQIRDLPNGTKIKIVLE